MYCQWAAWDGAPLADKPLFYHGVTREAAALVEVLQSEALAVVRAMSDYLGLAEPARFDDLRTQLEVFYRGRIGDASTLYSAMRTNEAYAGMYHPVTQVRLDCMQTKPPATAWRIGLKGAWIGPV